MRKLVGALAGVAVLLLAAVGYLAQFRPLVTVIPAAEVDEVSRKSGLADCFWLGVSTQGGLIPYPDTGATYWLTQVALPRGATLEFSGEFPHARHLSFNVYDPQGQPVDRLNDFMIEPAPGSSNPFRVGARRDAVQRTYTFRIAEADVKAGAPIAELDGMRPQNTLFMPDGQEPTRLWMRIYAADRGLDAKGGVALPVPVLLLADGSQLSGEALCRRIVVKEGAVAMTNLARGANQVLLGLSSSTSPHHPAQPEPRWFAFYNPPYAVMPYLFGTRFEWLSSVLSTRRKGGFFSTLDNTYMATLIDRRLGDVLVISGKAPRTPATLARGVEMQAADLRYWSLCQYRSLHDPSVQSCVFDEQVPQDAAGRYTIVVSSAEHRPANATAECGVAWMDWGHAGDGMDNPAGGMLVYRQMMPAPEFRQSLFETQVPGDEARVLGPYYPQARYTARAAFEGRGCARTAP